MDGYRYQNSRPNLGITHEELGNSKSNRQHPVKMSLKNTLAIIKILTAISKED